MSDVSAGPVRAISAYVAEVEPEALTALTEFPRIVSAVPADKLPHRRLAEFERLYDDMPGPNYGWWQCRLHVAAGHLFDASGSDGVRRLWEAFRVRDDELVETLETKIHAELGAIARELR